MDKEILYKYNFSELRKMSQEMGLQTKRSKEEYIKDIKNAFIEYEEYKHKKVDKYTKIRQLGNKGKEGITYLVNDEKGRQFAMKTFRKQKSSVMLKKEYELQKKAASCGVSPRVVEYDSVSKYIVMEKLDQHLLDVMKKQKGCLNRSQQLEIIEIYKKLDQIRVFHADSNILNYMIKNKKIYIIDFGFAKEIDGKLIKKLGTDIPNIKIMTLGLIIKLKELNCNPSSWKYLKKYITKEEIDKFRIE